MKKRVVLGITAGDLNGIGPEIALKAAAAGGWPKNISLVLVGSEAMWRAQACEFGLPLPPRWYPDAPQPPPPASIWDPAPELAPAWRPGKIRAEAAIAAHAWICSTVWACMEGALDGMVTAPISKEGFQHAGIHVPGHTELLAELTETKRYAMLLFGGGLRVLLATRHLPLAQVPAALTRREICWNIEMAATALPWLGCPQARIAVCGLNPHAGDGGALGNEERKIIAPAIRQALKKGYAVKGPVPADVAFYQALHGVHDLVIAMYHDQGLAPLKMLAFEEGVNVTLGLPIVRTSPDHGTAFDLAGRNRANPSSMRAAIDWACRLAQRPNPWR